MLKYAFYRERHLPSNGTTANVALHDLDLNFEGQTFHVAILTSTCWKMQTLQLPSDRKSGICYRTALLRMSYSTIVI